MARLNVKSRELDATLAARDAELNSARKQSDALTFKLHDLESAANEARMENDEIKKYEICILY